MKKQVPIKYQIFVWLYQLTRPFAVILGGKRYASYQYGFDLVSVLYGNDAALYLYGQSFAETGGGKGLFPKINNAFGMRPARVRPCWYQGDSNNFATYRNIAQSIIDVVLWYEYIAQVRILTIKEKDTTTNSNKFYSVLYSAVMEKNYTAASDFQVYAKNFWAGVSSYRAKRGVVYFAFLLFIAVPSVCYALIYRKIWKRKR